MNAWAQRAGLVVGATVAAALCLIPTPGDADLRAVNTDSTPGNSQPSSSELQLIDGFTTWLSLAKSSIMEMPKKRAWSLHAPFVKRVSIRSTLDGASQPALFYDSGSPEKKPLLLVLHSWSETYEQQYGIPYGIWAQQNNWVFIHPQFRGEFDDPNATCSDLAVQDVLDALAYAREHANVDPDRIYLTGFSGGAMMALVLAGRYPDLWTAVAAWVPVFDLESWYAEVRDRYHHYAVEIRASCGGAPVPGSAAAEECRRRSPATYLEGARGKPVRIYIATGIDDPFVSPAHSLRAFNVLARQEDRFEADQIAEFLRTRNVMQDSNTPVTDPLYDRAARPLLLERSSSNVTLKIFKGKHDVIYNAGLLWLGRQVRNNH